MDDNLPNFKYQKNKNWSLNERLRQYEVSFKGAAAFQIKTDIQNLNTEGIMNFDQTLCCIKVLTTSFDLSPTEKYVPSRYDENSTKIVGSLLSALAYTDSSNPAVKRKDNLKKNLLNENNVTTYWKYVEGMVNKVEITYPSSRITEQLLCYSEGLRSVLKYSPSWTREYEGFKLRTTAKLGQHLSSVLILPDNPANAVAALYGDQPRILFAEYNEAESAETTVNQFYGTDGAYAVHYRNLLDCRARYPGQKHLLQ